MTARGPAQHKYHTQLLLCALQRARRSEPLRVLHDAALTLAKEAGAEDADLAGFTPAVAKGIIRSLCERSQAATGRAGGDPRSATVKLYRLANPEPELDVPAPPRPRPVSTDAARVATVEREPQVKPARMNGFRPAAMDRVADDERAFYEAFAKDAARVLVTVERLLQELRVHHAHAYLALQGKQE